MNKPDLPIPKTHHPASMLQAARTAANIAESSASPSDISINELIPPSYYKITTPWDQVSIKDKVPFITNLNEKIFAR